MELEKEEKLMMMMMMMMMEQKTVNPVAYACGTVVCSREVCSVLSVTVREPKEYARRKYC
jgi:hypothetical protein